MRTRVRRPAQRGQALVEFAICSVFLLMLLAGAIDFGTAYSNRLEVANAARVGARWASLHSGDVSHGWTAVTNPAENTIPGQVVYAGDTRTILNDDTHLIIKYYIWTAGTTTTTYCGEYDQAHDNTGSGGGNDGFVGAAASGGGTYAESTCIAVGNVVQVTVRYDYPILTPMFSAMISKTLSIQSQAAFVIQS